MYCHDSEGIICPTGGEAPVCRADADRPGSGTVLKDGRLGSDVEVGRIHDNGILTRRARVGRVLRDGTWPNIR